MRTDGLFTTHHHSQEVAVGEPVYLCPVSDIHRDNALHAETEWKQWLDYARRERSKAMFLGLGDGLDFARAHERALLASGGEEGKGIENALQNSCQLWADTLIEELKPIRSRFIGWMSGNHYFEFVSGDGGRKERLHSDQYIADQLGCKYLGAMSAITITLRDKRGTGSADVRIIAHHGSGGATTVGGSLNRVQRMLRGWHASIALMGDDHKRGIIPVGSMLSSEWHEGRPLLVDHVQYVARTGSFLCGFMPGKSSYVVDAAYEPTSIGTIEIEMRLVRCPRTKKLTVKLRGIC